LVGTVVSVLENSNHNGTVLIKTVRVIVMNKKGQRVTARLLFDEGSNHSYIRTSTAQYLGLPVQFELQTTLFGGQKTTSKIKRTFSVLLQSCESGYKGEFNLINEDTI